MKDDIGKIVATLREAIDAAKAGGYHDDLPFYDEYTGLWTIQDGDGAYSCPSIVEMLYNPHFARAIWGKDSYKKHVDAMKQAPNPLEYLAEELARRKQGIVLG